MTPERYEKIVAPLRRHPRAVAAMAGANQALTALCYIAYPLLLLVLLGERDGRFWRCLLVPAVSFTAVTLFRAACNAPRPYEQGIDALLKKKRAGHSFPSRHVFSAVMIAVTAAYLSPALSVPLFAVAALLALIRVLGGVHYPRDVLCGALFCAGRRRDRLLADPLKNGKTGTDRVRIGSCFLFAVFTGARRSRRRGSLPRSRRPGGRLRRSFRRQTRRGLRSRRRGKSCRNCRPRSFLCLRSRRPGGRLRRNCLRRIHPNRLRSRRRGGHCAGRRAAPGA